MGAIGSWRAAVPGRARAQYRTHMYQPTDLERPAAGEPVPCLGDLGDGRVTVQVLRNGDTLVLKDQCRSGSAQCFPFRGWIGTTTFVRRPE
eukprot:2437565-Lingulodinium_polyedra.AAC.1